MLANIDFHIFLFPITPHNFSISHNFDLKENNYRARSDDAQGVGATLAANG